MKKIISRLFVIAILSTVIAMISVAASGQVTIPESPFLYKSQENYQDNFVDDSVFDTAHNRVIPIKIRYPAGATGRLPLVLWSHGGGVDTNGREFSVKWGRTLAKAGYIVIHLSHVPGLPGDREALCVEFAVETQADCDNFPVLSVWRPRDANAVLAKLDILEQRHPEISIDRNNIAVAGWSYGSFTAVALAGARFRFSNTFNDVSFANPLPKVFLATSPQSSSNWGYKQDSWREISRPVLMATGAGDFADNDGPETRIVPFQSMPAGKKYQLFIKDPEAIHHTFNLDNDARPEFSVWLASYSLAYLDANLKNRLGGQGFLISNRLPVYGSRKTVEISRK